MITFTCNVVSYTLYAVHVHRRFLSRKGVKFHTPEEEQQWAKAIKAMNAHIRYRRIKAVSRKKDKPQSGKKDTQQCGGQVDEHDEHDEHDSEI